MPILSNRTESDSESRLDDQDEFVESDFGWEDREQLSDIKNKKLEIKLIKLANQKFSLHSLFKKYNIIFELRGGNNGWTQCCLCPFKDHMEKTPSFYFNSKQNKFHCFGCQRSGQAVEFISILENRSKSIIAREILKDSININELLEEESDQEQEKIDSLLLEFSFFIRDFVSKNRNTKTIKYSEAITQSLDFYLQQLYISGKDISVEKLEARLFKLRERILEFSDL